MLPSIEILDNKNPDQLLTRATAEDHQVLQTMIRQLEQEISQSKPRHLIAYPLVKLSESLATEALNSRFTDLNFVDDGDSQQLLVWALENQPRVAQLLQNVAYGLMSFARSRNDQRSGSIIGGNGC